jgi:hypothetical protein
MAHLEIIESQAFLNKKKDKILRYNILLQGSYLERPLFKLKKEKNIVRI